MKQHILIEDLNTLSDKGKERLREWWKPVFGDLMLDGDGCEVLNDYYTLSKQSVALPLLSIGQMIEFLDELHKKFGGGFNYHLKHNVNDDSKDKWVLITYLDKQGFAIGGKQELVYVLWDEIKEILNAK